jgi:hypothetical protein
MPEYAAKSSGHWYHNGGREARDDARLVREAAAEIERLRAVIHKLPPALAFKLVDEMPDLPDEAAIYGR